MERLSVTKLISSLRVFLRDFWLSYKALEKVMNPDRFNEIKLSLMKSKRINEKYLKEIDIEEFEKEKQIIDSEWKLENEEAKASGTAIHEYLHKLLTADTISAKREYDIPTDLYLVIQTDKFLNTEKGIFSEFKMELPLDEDITLVGVADLIIKDGNHITIVEFKTDKKIEFKSRYDLGKKKNKTMAFPLGKLADANGVHYQLLLSLYAYMLLKLNPDFIIDNLKILHIKNLKKVKEHSVEYLKDSVEKLLTWETKNIKLNQRLLGCKRIEYKEFLNTDINED